jgi:5-methylcytosine-specific restriction endonuclease McrA
MTKPVSRRMAVDCLLHRFMCGTGNIYRISTDGIALVCGICKKILEPGQDIEFDHIHADIFDGPHEYQNIRPLHKACHKKKTARDISANAKIKRLTGQTKGRPKKRWAKGPRLRSRPFYKAAKSA